MPNLIAAVRTEFSWSRYYISQAATPIHKNRPARARPKNPSGTLRPGVAGINYQPSRGIDATALRQPVGGIEPRLSRLLSPRCRSFGGSMSGRRDVTPSAAKAKRVQSIDLLRIG